MSTRNNDEQNGLSITRIETSDTISQFMEKCNNNFSNLLAYGGGTVGAQGDAGEQGVPAKPKVPIHVWKKGEGDGFQYRDEGTTETGEYIIVDYYENLQDVKYQQGHLIILENAHVYILNNQNGNLEPTFLLALQSYEPGSIVNGKNAYVHIAYADSPNGSDNFITADRLRGEEYASEPITTFNLRNIETYSNSDVNEKSYTYMGIYSDDKQYSSQEPYPYTWVRIQGAKGDNGNDGINGADGTNGADGASAMHLELTQDYIAVPASANGNGLHKNFIEDTNSKIQSRMILYNGDTEITKDITYIFRIDGENASSYIIENNNGIFTVDKNKIMGDTNIECIATYTPTGTSFYKTLFIDVESTPYELEIDKNTLSRKVVSVDENGNIENGYIVDTSINVKVKYWKNGSWCYVTDGDVLVEYSEGEVHFTKDASNKTYTLTIAEDNIKKNIIDLEVKIVYKEGTNILSYENIGIINNGVDGVTKFKSTVFTRSVEEPEYPKDGSFDDPNPINSNIWKDGIPKGSEPIWSSYRWFSNKDGFVSSWSKPVLMCDTPDFEVMYSSFGDITDRNPNVATTTTAFYKDANGGISEWLEETGLDSKWTDDGDINSIWMATINKTNGKWGKWTISKIKGENGADGTSGTDGDTPELIKTERIGFSTSEHDIPDGEIDNNYLSLWEKSIGDLGDLGIAQPIYILYKQTWKYKNSTTDFPTYYITTTLSGTQGVEGKSRVLFYLGSFKNGEATLTGESVIGHLTPERCDYYIDFYGIAWMRIGQEDNNGVGVAGSKDGNSNSSKSWQKSDTVGFLQAGAIHADMINTNTITANSEIVTKLFSEEITANNLKVNAANITGTLTIGSNSENKGVSLNGNLSDYIGEGTITSTKIQDGAITTGKIAANAIKAFEIDASQIKTGTITADKIDVENLTASILTTEKISAFELDASQIKTGILSADKIDAENLSVKKLNTTGNNIGKGTIYIENNDIKVYNKGSSKEILRITGDELTALPTYFEMDVPHSTVNVCSGNSTMGNMLSSGVFTKYYRHGTITVPDGYTYNLYNPFNYSIEINLTRQGISTGNNIPCHLSFDYCIVEDSYESDFIKQYSTRKPSKTFTDLTNNNTYNNLLTADIEFGSSNDFFFTPWRTSNSTSNSTTYKKQFRGNGSSLLFYNGQYPIYNSTILKPGTYHLYSRTYLGVESRYTGNFTNVQCTIYPYTYTLTFKSILPDPMSEISSYGFRYVVSDKKYASLTKDGTFLFRNGNYILAVDDNGIGISTNGSIDNVRQIIPREFKFRTDMNDGSDSTGKKWNTMTVLTLGNIISVDDGD